jgi:hypothetical protein
MNKEYFGEEQYIVSFGIPGKDEVETTLLNPPCGMDDREMKSYFQKYLRETHGGEYKVISWEFIPEDEEDGGFFGGFCERKTFAKDIPD